jgi:hypothetical protein
VKKRCHQKGFAATGADEYIFNLLSLLSNITNVKSKFLNAPTNSNTFYVTVHAVGQCELIISGRLHRHIKYYLKNVYALSSGIRPLF